MSLCACLCMSMYVCMEAMMAWWRDVERGEGTRGLTVRRRQEERDSEK